MKKIFASLWTITAAVTGLVAFGLVAGYAVAPGLVLFGAIATPALIGSAKAMAS